MKLQQLRYLREVIKRDLNITAASLALHTSQPGVSRQIALLEEEFGLRLFSRQGRSLKQLTPAGRLIAKEVELLLDKAEAVQRLAAELADPEQGTLTIATTHTQARYMLPAIVTRFLQQYPRVRLHLNQGTPAQVSAMVAEGEADFALATEAMAREEALLALPCYRWRHCLLVRPDHPLNTLQELTVQAIADYPIVTYIYGFTGRSRLDAAFSSHGLEPNVVLMASDADVIKTYVRLGLGVGIIADMAFEADKDTDLRALELSPSFGSNITRVGLRRDGFLPRFAYDFIEMLSPHLTRECIEQSRELSPQQLDSQFGFIEDGE